MGSIDVNIFQEIFEKIVDINRRDQITSGKVSKSDESLGLRVAFSLLDFHSLKKKE